MIKRIAIILAICSIMLTVAACGKSTVIESSVSESAVEDSTALETGSNVYEEVDTDVSDEKVTTDLNTDTTETTRIRATKLIKAVKITRTPYTTQLYASAGIYTTPSLYGEYVRSVAATGIYTIVEESRDNAGNLWGKLKAGHGWVLLEVNTSSSGYFCPRCGATDPYDFADDWVSGDLCIWCNRYLFHYGEDGGLFCSQCHRDASYMGLYEDGRCEFCHELD